MSDIKWSKKQLEAIDARSQNVLVNAAAGSGKTAVLTTRIIKRLVPDDNEAPIKADRLLVVTFTRAAASEMRERIEEGLKALVKETGEKGDQKKRRFIQKQIKQLQGAKICTIDSYCQSLIKEYFHLLNIDPDFRIALNSEEKELRSEVFDKLSEKLYTEKDKDFLDLVRKCTKSGREDMLKSLADSILDFTSNMPYPEKFIKESSEEYKVFAGFFNTKWYKKLKEDIEEEIKLYQDEKNGRNDSDFEEETENLKSLLTADFSETENFLKEVFYPEINPLCIFTIKYFNEIEKAKRERSIMSFSDIERAAYRLLKENDALKEEQSARYDEILIDEYQDTNELQDGIFQMLSKGDNLFMVGDMKQSIYRFRSSDPLVFRSKADMYKEDSDAALRKITLSENYRSRSEVLLSVNDLFKAQMSRVTGELLYDSSQELNLGNKGYSDTGFSYKSEFALIEVSDTDDDTPDSAESEAEYIAKRIIDMKNNGFLVRDNDILRPIKNSDIMILMSSHKTDGELYVETFSKYGLDCTCTKEGYFEKAEIKLIMALLSALDNLERDIQMASVMRSFIGGFSDDELARIRINGKNVSFFDSLLDIASKYRLLKEKGTITPSGEIFGEKVVSFVGKINSWQEKARYMSADSLLNMLFEEAGFYVYFSEERLENLRLFIDKAKTYEASGYRGLFSFLRHMQKLSKASDDLKTGNADNESDSIRIMTIHKSKGLEFPLVFLAGCGKRFNKKDAWGKLLMHQKLGISLDYLDYNESILILSPIKDIFERVIKKELLSEEMRKLYVALTRAKEKLIVTAAIKKTSTLDSKLEKWQKAENLRIVAKNANTFLDWLAPVSMNSENWEFKHIKGALQKISITNKPQVKEIKLPDKEKMLEILNYEYPYAAIGLKSKAAVSEFKGTEHFSMQKKPKFLRGNKLSGADFGTAVHKIMETLPRNMGEDAEFVSKHIKSLMENGDIDPCVKASINADKIVGFFKSAVGKRYMAAKSVNTESEFKIAFDANELYNDEGLIGEKILLHGVIDCWFEEEDGIVLVDYKTDKVDNIEEIHEKYDNQLRLYASALEKIAKKRVKDKFIYLFSKECVIQC